MTINRSTEDDAAVGGSMEESTIPLRSFDLTLLPEGARDVASPEFPDAVTEFFRRQFRELGANGVVTVTPEQISVGWVTHGFDPVSAAVAKLKRGQLREGAQLLEVARSRRPDSPDLLFNLGVARSELGELDQAIAILSHLVEIDPEYVHGLVALGVALGRSGRTAEAMTPLVRAVELAPADAWAQKNLGGLLFRLNRGTEARPHLEAAVRLAPDDAQAWLHLGEICLSIGEKEPGRDALKRARSLDPHGPIRDRADAALNRLAAIELPRNSDGINPDALAAMIWAVGHLRSLSAQAAQHLTLQAALIGQHGLRFSDTKRVFRLEGLHEPLTTLQLACLIHAGVQSYAPNTQSGLPLENEYKTACHSIE